MFNDTEDEMNRPASKAGKAERESVWRGRLARYASGDHTVAAFCQSESVSTASFYGWRSKLRAEKSAAAEGQSTLPGRSPFIDLGSINATASGNPTVPNNAGHLETRSSLEVRIDLGDGVLLTITRH